MKTYIVIPSYIVTEELKELATNTIKSIRKSSPEAIIVNVDDGSPMDCTFLKELGDIYIKNKENSGFGITCNNGFKRVFKESKDDCYIVCANNDIEVFPGWLQAMKYQMEHWDNVAFAGLISSKERMIEGNIPIEEFKIPLITEGGLLRGWMQSGGLWMSSKKVLQKIGLFDEQFIRGGYEDVDIFLRARDTFGMKILMSGHSMFWHKEGATRWNCEKNDYINNFNVENKAIEDLNWERFRNKWGYDPHTRQVWRCNENF